MNYAQSDLETLQILFEKDYEKLCQVAFRITRNSEDARDVVMQVFEKFWSSIDKWHTIQSKESYLYTTVYHAALNHLKKEKKMKALWNETSSNISTENQTTNWDDLMQIEQKIMMAINSLPDKCKEIFVLSREAQMSYKAIALHLNISIKTVETQMGIALKKIRSHVGPLEITH